MVTYTSAHARALCWAHERGKIRANVVPTKAALRPQVEQGKLWIVRSSEFGTGPMAKLVQFPFSSLNPKMA